MIYLPTLYKTTKTGAVQEWTIGYGQDIEAYYKITFGQQGGAIQEKINYVHGKNVGRANETSDIEQAELEAKSRWLAQKDKGYLESGEKPSELLLPMLAQDYKKYSHKVSFPCYIQPKLDGCVSGDTILDTKEYGNTTISNIVDNQLKCSVKSFNTKTGKLEYKPVVSYFLNRELDEEVEWFKITLESGHTLELTGNHLVYLPDLQCWRRVDSLNGDENLMVY